jgi:hypothetical protein
MASVVKVCSRGGVVLMIRTGDKMGRMMWWWSGRRRQWCNWIVTLTRSGLHNQTTARAPKLMSVSCGPHGCYKSGCYTFLFNSVPFALLYHPSLSTIWNVQRCQDAKEWVSPAFVFTYKLFRTALNYIYALTSNRKVPKLLSNFNQIGISRQIFIKVSNIKFKENPSWHSWTCIYIYTHTHTHTHIYIYIYIYIYTHTHIHEQSDEHIWRN